MQRVSSMMFVTVAFALAMPPEAAGQRFQWQTPSCKLDEGHYLIRGARTYVARASTSELEAQKHMTDARRVLMEALIEKRLTDRAGLWYYLGHVYRYYNDYAGADSAFDRAERLQPDCAEDISDWRRRMWVPILNRALRAQQAGQQDSAIYYSRLANSIYDGEPQAFLNLGGVYANADQVDSAVHYLKRGIAVAGDREEFAEEVRAARFNVARLYHRAEQYDSAAAAYRGYLAVDSSNIAALSGLASVLATQGKESEATELYDRIVASAEQADALDLFQAGTALFNGKLYDRAAQAFELGLAKLPHHRDGLYNLANTYLSLKNGEKMLPVAERLVAIDPLGERSLRLLAAAHQQLGQPEQTLELLQKLEAMTVAVSILQFTPDPRQAALIGQVVNRTDAARPGITLRFEFLNAAGEVVASEDVSTGEIAGQDVSAFRLTPPGEGIVSWRYAVVAG